MIKALIFDWGGVLGPDSNKLTSEILSQKYGLDKDALNHDLDSLEDQYSTVSDNANYYTTISLKHNLPKNILRKTLNSIPAGPVFLFVKKIKNMKRYILSNQMKPKTDAIRKNNDLKFFNDLFFSNEIGLMKPDKKIFKYMLKKIRLKPEECIFIDDLKENIKSAAAIGFHTIYFQNIKQFQKELAKYNI